MGLFDKVNEAHKQRQEKRVEQNKLRGPLLAIQMVDFIGGYNDKRKSTGMLAFFENQTEYSATLNPGASFTIQAADIVDVAIEGKDEVSRRVTVTRLLSTGIFAFALQKKRNEKEVFITVILADGQNAVFHMNNVAPMVIKAKLSKVTARMRQNAPKPTNATSPISVADELAKLAKLKDNGIITQAEFDKQKAELLA